MPSNKEAARRAERPYEGCEDVANKLDVDEALYRVLCRLDRARFLRALELGDVSRGLVVPHLALLQQLRVTWYIRSEEQMVRGAQTDYSGSPRGNLDANQQLRMEAELTLAAVAVAAERWMIHDALSGFRALA